MKEYPTPATRTRAGPPFTWVMQRPAALFLECAGAGVDFAVDHQRVVRVVDVRGARHARVERADGPQDVDPLEVLRLLEVLQDRGSENGLLVRARLAERVHRRGVPGGRGHDLVVLDQALVHGHVVGQPAATRAPQTGRLDLALGDLEVREGLVVAVLDELPRL